MNGSDALKHNGGINYTAEGGAKRSRFIDLRIENNEIYHVDRSGIFGWSDNGCANDGFRVLALWSVAIRFTISAATASWWWPRRAR